MAMKNAKQDFFGPSANEKWHLFLYNKKSKLPFHIENIGITYPNPKYKISRDNSDLFVIEYVLSGKGYLEINGVKHTIEKDDLYIIEPHTKHSIYADVEDPYTKVWINFKSNLFATVFNAFGLNDINVFKNTNAKNYFDELLLIAEKSFNSDDVAIDVSNVLFNIVYILTKQTYDSSTRVMKLAQEIKNMLDNALYGKISLEYIASELHYSKKQINRVFSKVYGVAPYTYYIDIKIKMAKNLLVMTDLSVKEIADKLCFENQYYFSNMFKSKTGMSPLKYRASRTK